MSLPPTDFLIPRTMVVASILDLDMFGPGIHHDVLEETVLFALRRDPDAIVDYLAAMLQCEKREVRVWAASKLIACLRLWEVNR